MEEKKCNSRDDVLPGLFLVCKQSLSRMSAIGPAATRPYLTHNAENWESSQIYTFAFCSIVRVLFSRHEGALSLWRCSHTSEWIYVVVPGFSFKMIVQTCREHVLTYRGRPCVLRFFHKVGSA